jgi:hypothetical protein
MNQENEFPEEQAKDSVAYRERISSRQASLFSYAGLLFVFASLGCMTGLVWQLTLGAFIGSYVQKQVSITTKDDKPNTGAG